MPLGECGTMRWLRFDPRRFVSYVANSVRRRHMLLIRDYGGVKAWGDEAQRAMERASHDAAAALHLNRIFRTFGAD
jgi:hypothetical protein